MSRKHPIAGPPIAKFGDEKSEAALRAETSDATENMAGWLQEVARRPWPQSGADAATASAAATPAADMADSARGNHPVAASTRAAPRSVRPTLRHALILTALTGAFMQYYFIEINLRIVSMHAVTVFAPAGTPREAAKSAGRSPAALNRRRAELGNPDVVQRT